MASSASRVIDVTAKRSKTLPDAEPGIVDKVEVDRLLQSAAVLVVDDEPGMRNFLKRALESRLSLIHI